MTSEEIKEKIQIKFGTLQAYADFKGESLQGLSKKIKKPSKKFLLQLREDGIIEQQGYRRVMTGDDFDKLKKEFDEFKNIVFKKILKHDTEIDEMRKGK